MPVDDRVFEHRVDAAGVIRHVNDSWLQFALENGADGLGADAVIGMSLFDYIADPTTRHLYDLLHRRVLRSERTVTVPYRCDSPTLRRFMEMELCASAGLLVYRNRVVRLEERAAVELWDPEIERQGSAVRSCGWCKKLPLPDGRWLEVEEAVAELGLLEAPRPPPITHGICPVCERLVRADIPAESAGGSVAQ